MLTIATSTRRSNTTARSWPLGRASGGAIVLALVVGAGGCGQRVGDPGPEPAGAAQDAGTDAGADVGAPHEARTALAVTCTSNAACDDSNSCTKDTCAKGTCSHTALKSGTSCTTDACHAAGTCNSSGTCNAGKPLKIDDGNLCTTDSCDPVKGVSHTPTPNGSSCFDGNKCHGTQTCDGKGTCVATNVPILQSGLCAFDTCDPETGKVTHTIEPAGWACSADRCLFPMSCDGDGACVSVPPPVIDDGNPCTADACAGDVGVVHSPVAAGTACGDNSNPCVGALTCNGSATCVQASGPTIDDGNACTIDTCTPQSGVTHTVLRASDDNPCTIDACDPAAGLSHTPASAGAPCSDGDACNGGETCDGHGACATTSPPPLADDGNPCTIDWCDATSGPRHVPGPAGVTCSDGNACNGVETCGSSGACTPGAPPTTDDGNDCTADSCDPLLGATHQPIATQACLASEAAWAPSAVGRPSPRDSFALAYDATSATTLLFGGENAGAPLGDFWSFDGASRTWTPGAKAGPSPRAGAAYALDPERRKLVVFGGEARGLAGETVLGDTWEYDIAQGSWARRAQGGPTARAYAAMAFDPTTHHVVLVGGATPLGPGATDGPWTWDSAQGAWSLQPVAAGTAPSPRFGGAMAWSPGRARLVLFGGASTELPRAGTALGDTWELDPLTWTWSVSPATRSPSARAGSAVALDAARGAIVLFGGTGDAARNLADTWEYDGEWTSRPTPTGPSGRAGHALAYDSGRARIVLFGGLRYSDSASATPGLDDTWEYEGVAGAWTPAGASAAPAALARGAAFDSARSVLVARGDESLPQMWEADGAGLRFASRDPYAGSGDFGAAVRGALGSDVGPQPMAFVASRARTVLITRGGGPQLVYIPQAATTVGVWEWDGAAWTQRACTGGPYALENASITYDSARDRVLLFGGDVPSGLAGTSPGPTNGLWELDPVACAWSQRAAGAGPGPRLNALGAWDTDRARWVLFGGSLSASGGPYLGDTWELDSGAGAWTQAATSGPPPRTGGAMTYDARRKRVILFGGATLGGQHLGDVWEYDGASHTWTEAAPPLAPSPRKEASLTFNPSRGTSVLLGGKDPRGPLQDEWEWDGTVWTRVRSGAAPSARSGADAAWSQVQQVAVLFGGVRGDGERAFARDTWLFRDGDWARVGAEQPVALENAATSANPYGDLPDARAGHALAVSNDGHALLFGGEGDSGLLGDTWIFDVGALGWTMSKTFNHPDPRSGHALVALDSGFFFFGGATAAGPQQDAWLADVGGGWQILPSYGPPPRSAHALAYDAARRVVVLFGGLGASGPLADTWEWSQDTRAWTARSPATSPSARFGHRLVLDPNRGVIVLTGGAGATAGTESSEVWEYDGAKGLWTERVPGVALPPRAGHVAFFDALAQAPVVFGGLAHRGPSSAFSYGDTWTFARGGSSDATTPRYASGARCTGPSDCATGYCTDGVCCDSACGGQCAACDAPGSLGHCAPIAGAPRPTRTPCASIAACPVACDGADPQVCHAQAGIACASGSCTSGMSAEISRCDALGVCVPGRAHACDPLACNGASCACAVDADCGDASYFCGGGGCRPLARLSAYTLSGWQPTGNYVTVTLAASASGTVDPVYAFSYYPLPLGSPGYNVYCGGTGAASCVTSLPPGSWRVRVEVKDRLSPRAFDDAREITVGAM